VYAPPAYGPPPVYHPPVTKDGLPPGDDQPYPGGAYTPPPPVENRMPVTPPGDAQWQYVPGNPSFQGGHNGY
jgi:hypothetical protein